MSIKNFFPLILVVAQRCRPFAADPEPKKDNATTARSPPSKSRRRRRSFSRKAATRSSKANMTRPSNLLTKAVEADGGKTSYRLNLARALRYAGKEDAAVKQLEDILKASPDHVEAGQTLCEIYTAKNQWKEIVRVSSRC